MIHEITQNLYAEVPRETLYHYTSFSGLLGIVSNRALWASDIRYMNDSAELRHTADLIRREITQRIAAGHPDAHMLNQFLDWVTHRITNGHLLFAASFRSNGNLLSQWRGYSRLGKGVSIGFDPNYILQCARAQSFQIGKCIYDPAEQQRLIVQVVDAAEALTRQSGPTAVGGDPPDDSAYHTIFQQIEGDLLRIAAVLKHPAFLEEAEWRIVSPAITDYVHAPVLFREGAFNLVPYIEFQFNAAADRPIAIEHVFLGPTPNINISMNSLNMYLSKNDVSPKHGIDYCRIPFRQK